MKFAIAAAALVAGVNAAYPAGNVTYTTEVVTSYETYCPGPTTITYGTNTYTVTEATTLTITDCPCTISAPVYTTSAYPTTTYAPVPPTVYPNSTVITSTYYPTGTVPTTPATSIPTAAAGKVVAGLAGVLAAVAAAL